MTRKSYTMRAWRRWRECMSSASKMVKDYFSRYRSRECECLQWIAAGKSDWDIGHILSISEKDSGESH